MIPKNGSYLKKEDEPKKISNEYSIWILRIMNSYIISYIAFYETVINNLAIILYYKIKNELQLYNNDWTTEGIC